MKKFFFFLLVMALSFVSGLLLETGSLPMWRTVFGVMCVCFTYLAVVRLFEGDGLGQPAK